MGSDRDQQAEHAIVSIIKSTAPQQGSGEWRPSRCAAIRDRCTSVLGDEFAYVAFTLRHFGKSSLADLSDHELERTWRHVKARRPS